jgi:hypothetical protein
VRIDLTGDIHRMDTGGIDDGICPDAIWLTVPVAEMDDDLFI